MNLFQSLVPAFNRTPATCSTASAEDLGATVKPRYEIDEKPDAFGLTVQLPGVAKDGLEITAEDSLLRIVGKRAWIRPTDWTSLYRESSDATFLLELDHDHAINLDDVRAELSDGVLQVTLPKAEALKPRKITVA